MLPIFSSLLSFFSSSDRVDSASRAAIAGGVPYRLLEGADACAGHNPHEAAELRHAASAYLRVVR